MRKNLLFLLFFATCGNFLFAQSEDFPENPNVESDSLKMVVQQLQDQISEKDAELQEMKDMERYEKVWGKRKKYTNIGYCIMNLDGMPVPESKFGFSYSMGRTYYLHKKPLAGMIKFGLDFSYLDVTVASFDNSNGKGLSFGDDEEALEIDLKRNYLDYTMQIGPSVTVNPIDQLKVSAYGRFAPSASFITMNDYAYVQFVPHFTCGLSVSYKVIGLGIEGRWGKANYKGFSLDEDSMEFGEDNINDEGDIEFPNPNDMFKTSKRKFSNKSFKIYISFRF